MSSVLPGVADVLASLLTPHKVLMSDDDHISDCGAVIYAREYYADWAPHLVPQHKEDK